jgi:hypothetical protein
LNTVSSKWWLWHDGMIHCVLFVPEWNFFSLLFKDAHY